ncbi:putative short chain oxidoreductase/dehydrogenase [Xylariaceae sp. FL0662B]|nr:putative short chain oxidoreductase/dehydrogenase [Xylariaceae sp. FL0662B]
MADPQVWLVTGSSRGLGLGIVRAAQRAGHVVVACYRNKGNKPPAFAEVEALGGSSLELDLVADNVESQIQSVIARYGKIDVLVNNAGYAVLSSLEDMSLVDIRTIFNTIVIGTLRTIQAVLPSMRERKSGTIVNISSASGINGTPSLAVYSGTKFAIEGITESLQAELAPFNIRTLLVEPSSMTTDMLGSSGASYRLPVSDPYKDTVIGQANSWVGSPQHLAIAADPVKVAQRIVEAIDGTGVMAGREVDLRLPLGKEAGAAVEKRAELFTDLAKNMKDMWESV